MTATLSNDEWGKLSRNIGKAAVKDPNTSSGTASDSSPATMPSGSITKSSDLPPHQQGTLAPQSYAAVESGITISKMPDLSASPYHPSDDVNRQLLLKFPNCKMVITNDHAWLSIVNGEDEIVSDPEQFLEQVLASHDVRIENRVLRLGPKYEIHGYDPSSSLSNSRWVVEEVDECNMADGDDPEVDTRNPSGNGRTNKKPGIEEENCNSPLQTRQAALKFRQHKKALLSKLQAKAEFLCQENERLRAALISSQNEISRLSTLVGGGGVVGSLPVDVNNHDGPIVQPMSVNVSISDKRVHSGSRCSSPGADQLADQWFGPSRRRITW